MINKDLVKNKMIDIQNYFTELEPLIKEEARDIIENNLKLRSLERLFQLIVDTALDINTHIIAESNLKVPDDYQSTFITLGENKIIPIDFANKIAPSVGLRNLIIHKYGKVDIKKMVDNIKTEIGDYLNYLKYIDTYLKNN